MPTTPPLIGLLSMQFLLYSAGWALCSLLFGIERRASLQWSLCMALCSAGFMLVGMRGDPRTLLAYPGATIAVIAGLVALARGMEHFVRLPPADRHYLALFGLAAGGLLCLGAAADAAAWRVILTFAAAAAIVGLSVCRIAPRACVEFGRIRVALVLAPALVLVAHFVLRALLQALDPDRSREFEPSNVTHHGVLFAYLIGAALFNFSFIALIVSRLLHSLRDEVRRDALTGLPNRRAFEQELAREWQRLQRKGPRFALLALDLDHFKEVNDRHGHLVGDAVLEETGRRLLAAARGTDVVARVGGEEFSVLVPAANWDSAKAAAERLRQALAARAVQVQGHELRVTVSVGVTLADPADAGPQQAIERADTALYRAKAAGRNCVVVLGAD